MRIAMTIVTTIGITIVINGCTRVFQRIAFTDGSDEGTVCVLRSARSGMLLRLHFGRSLFCSM